MSSKIYLWVPELYKSKGGVQTYSHFFLNALNELSKSHNFEIVLFIKNDHNKCAEKLPNDIKSLSFGEYPDNIVRTIIFVVVLTIKAILDRPNLVVTTLINFIPLAARLNKVLNIPFLFVAHGFESWGIQEPNLIAALGKTKRIISVSKYTQERIIEEQKIGYDKISVLPNTFALGRFEIKSKPKALLERFHLCADQPTLLTVARLDDGGRDKGYYPILKALPQIRAQVSDIHYIIVGKGNDVPNIQQTIKSLGLEECVTLAGFVPDEELCDYYNLCDLFVMPSKGEGFGIVYLEAMACGKPSIGSICGGAVDALCDGELGVLVDPDDTDAIVDSVVQVLQGRYPNPILYQPEVLRQKVIDNFGFERFKKNLAALLEEIV